jgi:3-oxoacyl-[acyl-carrier protein] reductase
MTTPLASWVCPLLEARTPLGRLGQPDDITPVAVFPASAASSWMTGEMIAVAGGFS